MKWPLVWRMTLDAAQETAQFEQEQARRVCTELKARVENERSQRDLAQRRASGYQATIRLQEDLLEDQEARGTTLARELGTLQKEFQSFKSECGDAKFFAYWINNRPKAKGERGPATWEKAQELAERLYEKRPRAKIKPRKVKK